MKILDLSHCKSNKEVSELIRARVKSVDCDELIRNLAQDFIYHEEATRRIYAALATGKNGILYGPGGFGKSVLVKAICKYLGLPVIYKVGYEGMTPEELLGVPDMTKLLEESKYETAFENSVFSKPGILVLEEGLDADASCLATLKDVLTEKGFREGDTKKESLIASVLICGNKTPEDVSINDSTKAFYQERFPYRHNMVWKNFSNVNYQNFFKVYYKDKYLENRELLMLVAKLCSNSENSISPRVATQAADTALELGVEFLDTVTDLDTSLISEMIHQVKKEAEQLTETELLDRIQFNVVDIINKLRTESNINVILKHRFTLSLIKDSMEDYDFTNDVFPRVLEINSLVSTGLGSIEHQLIDTIDTNEAIKLVNELFNPTTS